MLIRHRFMCILVVSAVAIIVVAVQSTTRGYKRHNTEEHVDINQFSKGEHILTLDSKSNSGQSCVYPAREPSGAPCPQNHLREKRRILNESLPWIELETTLNASKTLLPGGYHQPLGCASPQRLAIIIPYRDREVNLKILLNNLHRVLQKQQAEYVIFVVEQENGTPFNRGLIKNIGYLEAKARCHFDCFTFHDVDLVPESERNTYWCGTNAVHHARRLDIWKYRVIYTYLFGGVITFNETFFSTINGYSNLFFMWGAEDDDLFHRVRKKHLKFEVSKDPRYTALKHTKETRHPEEKIKIYTNSTQRMDTDGLNSMGRLYRVISVDYKPLYTRIYVSINQTEIYTQLRHYGINL
ncbi:beta-1,4-N-acetylgalactosaminyltransferase bre-4-like [Haliotis rufescens]|uniref:beta-1,4-N-acetylgalactosaminyltransferase bre-4-like n=1 Tax=Haliotis rufescens TaxID=6454 RepID=UPI00201F3D2D|nr:beta-1,4-N-acetylgalactosaminyltransferase bre-4-like [Haliotis rufescens]